MQNFKLQMSFFWISLLLFSSCYSYRWSTDRKDASPPPATIQALFEAGPQHEMVLDMDSPSLLEYDFDPAERAHSYTKESEALRFKKVKLKLREHMPKGKILIDICFEDLAGNKVDISSVDLLRLVPSIDAQGELQYPELLIEEFSRFGMSFRKEHKEFSITTVDELQPKVLEELDNSYRLSITNNCLDPCKWEMVLVNEDYSDFSDRLSSNIMLNQNRMLVHSWFRLPDALYRELMLVKNPNLEIDPDLARNFDELSKKASDVVIDFDKFRKIKCDIPLVLQEVGHQSGRKIEPVVSEQYFKFDFGLFVNKNQFPTYKDIVKGEEDVVLTSYEGNGYYKKGANKHFDYTWLGKVDQVALKRIEQHSSDCFVEFTLTGENSAYDLTFGNIDLSQLDERKVFSMAFGINPYPKGRRYNPKQNTLFYDTDFMPTDIRPYMFLTDHNTGKWINPFLDNSGIDRVYITWQSLKKNILDIYILSYERITPVWMASVKIDDDMVDRIRIRRFIN